jgi:hypothetical protein
MSSSITSCGHALKQSSQPLQYVSLTSIQPFAGIGTPYLSSRILFSGITAPSLSLYWLWASSAKRHTHNDTNIIPSERYNLYANLREFKKLAEIGVD